MANLVRSRKYTSSLLLSLKILLATSNLAFGLFLLPSIVDPIGILLLPLVLMWLALQVPLYRLLFQRKRLRPMNWQAGRAIWLTGALCVLWYAMFILADFIEGSHAILYGTWISIATALCLARWGLAIERLAFQDMCPRAELLPAGPARRRRGASGAVCGESPRGSTCSRS
ncbi:MAG: hypothetical protein GY811_25880 [Myxococcales bacterium]|nr:hypothetical protein [Myxococcales bacterium]